MKHYSTQLITILVPLLLMLFIVCVVTITTYLNPKGPWYAMIYPKGMNAFTESFTFADAIVYASKNVAIVYIEDKEQLSFINNNVLILDPLGVPLCLETNLVSKIRP